MNQAMDSEAENRAWLSPVLQEARSFRNMDIHQHAHLVQAIMLNFPEIYDPAVCERPAASVTTLDAEVPRPPTGPGYPATAPD